MAETNNGIPINMEGDMEFRDNETPDDHVGTGSTNELDPRVQSNLMLKIGQEIQQQVRAAFAALIPATGSHLSGPPGAGHSAGSASDNATDGRAPAHIPSRGFDFNSNVNFNWGSSLPQDGDQQEVSIQKVSEKFTSRNNSPIFPKNGDINVTQKRKRDPSGSSLENVHISEISIVSTPKKRKLTNDTIPCRKLKQTSLKSFFNTQVNTFSTELDRMNVANLVALEMNSITLFQREEQMVSSKEPELYSPAEISREETPIDIGNNWECSAEKIRKTKEREKLIFSEPNPVEACSIIGQDNKVDQVKLSTLRDEITKHSLKLFELGLRRAKEHVEACGLNKNSKQKGPNILTGLYNPPEGTIPTIQTHISKKCGKNASNSLSKQDEDGPMTGGTQNTWNKSRTSAVEAIKAKTRATFYREAPNKQLVEYWCYGLEKTPGFMMKMGPFRTALQAMRIRHAKEIMLLSAEFLDKEVARNNESASMMKAAAIKQIYESNSSDVADRIVREASASYDLTISNMATSEYKEFERRRRTLEESPLQRVISWIRPRTWLKPQREQTLRAITQKAARIRVFNKGDGATEVCLVPGEEEGRENLMLAQTKSDKIGQ